MRGIRGTLAVAAGMVLVAAGAQLLWPEAQAATGMAPAAAGQSAVRDPVPLLQLENGAGTPLWTLSRAEADAAVAQHGFRLLPNRLGYLRQAPFTGSQPVHRLTRVGASGWLLTASTSERDALVTSGRFRYEGVVGHAAARPADGLALLSRFSGPAGWRVSMEAPYGNPDELLGRGFKRDGPLGYVHPQWNRVGALYFGTWNAGSNSRIIQGGYDFYHRTYPDWWAGVRDYSGGDPSVPVYKGQWPDDDFSDRVPSIGFYDDSQVSTVEKHITQASSAGLDHFTFYWYWNPAERAERHAAGLRSFLRAGNRDALDFGVSVCAHAWDNGILKIPTDQYGLVAGALIDDYLAQPNYLRANDGRPIVWLCDTRGIGGGAAADVRSFVDTVRARARATLGEEILVLAHQDLGLQLGPVGADGDYCAAPYAAVRAGSYAGYVRGQKATFDRGAAAYVRCVMSDFDERPRYPILVPDAADATYLPDQSFELFAQAARNAATDVALSTRTSAVDNFVLVYAWNEWHEGGYVEPNARDGCRYLDILRQELKLTRGSGCVARP
ncbi:glycoside hydrolase family 99-like domain-containing protein [Phytohabitans suffuscus]|uniref:DUF5648 domain-containing protein n=1 Tax=Phytohabitans suffuscus TaxID=624315 RepID=A0A6F8YYP1_9ACTN|nr:glycoside hydrolase family 99-like domain-containing protein [Phytohabitans suffuscus]BCB91300.1 hypothetical protein Psuf_086130 [Phytohabitans suffuscus]